MEVAEKLKILADSAKYDVSCSSSGSDRKNTDKGIGNASLCGICHSFSADGRCISLLKILMTNSCIYDCKYCINRASNNIQRACFTPQEIADITINFYRRNYIEGLFLSSGIIKNPDYTMEMLCEAISILRNKYHFNGYIHAKTIPGASQDMINKLGLLVDRMSINIELPSNQSLKLLAPNKEKDAILEPMKYIKNTVKQDRKFVRAGQTTQLIIGATPESDFKILSLAEGMYGKMNMKRVYYSAYVPLNHDDHLPALKKPPLLRENRLYQADWLLRFYGFKVEDLLDDSHQNFNELLDPKADWALHNMDYFPVEINKADYYTLLRVPGIGVLSAKKIMAARKHHKLTFESLKKMRVVLKRAKYFITCDGKYFASTSFFNSNLISSALIHDERKLLIDSTDTVQLSLFEPTTKDRVECITGQL
ncbi:putative DNA modification/repair radical SAM protein [Breznakia sp. PF5-3]|uniref:putative DNA modification/repair radical SAM protein n=1 Tax=unclassified Breznakia TaxID=2623764 RepID=UPI002405DCF9|nr:MULTISPECIES: putative DNA modification/repair radical SAM protein [unclassified Breznakia]MDF9825630.1 putative DNA modification/repair radical SAM protein [Breznakia sp. PM6-1]MDF9836456.1 putative DNA modification/repair radical SAM protein [Breznakia sp. PF5-3]MDF9838631.1 putative DNA modification/repair radical SAM protein [Breznakia sp. PFB2-8]MDF9860662.1 putative DNA modification/repair radical SAM protein [Breznakia sp. PH5-24]